MAKAETFKALSKNRQRLVELATDVQFGSLVGLQFSGGEPDFTSAHAIYRRHHFGSTKERRTTKLRADFELKAPFIEFFELCDKLVDFDVDELKIENGLPQMMSTVEDAGI